MWFSNVRVFHYQIEADQNIADLLAEYRLKSCPAHARFVYGWTPVFSDELVQEVAGSSLICLTKEERLLPKGVINKILHEKIKTLETQQGRIVKRAEKAQIAEDIEFDLLPKSFCIQKKLLAILDTNTNRLIINTSSTNQASQLTGLLRKSIPGITIEPIIEAADSAVQFATWIQSPDSLPPCFQLASDCVLFSLDNEKKRIHCKGYELTAGEVLNLLAQGMATAEISLIWKERIQFTLTHDFSIKKIKSLEYLIDDFNEIKQLETEIEQHDAALTLLAGELRELTHDLIKTLSNQSILEEAL